MTLAGIVAVAACAGWVADWWFLRRARRCNEFAARAHATAARNYAAAIASLEMAAGIRPNVEVPPGGNVIRLPVRRPGQLPRTGSGRFTRPAGYAWDEAEYARELMDLDEPGAEGEGR